ncbi:MAG: ATP-binding protein [Acidobacteriota bacterium]|nr:ATP-binding protein [Acidobacteriota bacterium]
MPLLNEVFGVSTKVPKYTYVDRSGLDAKFDYLLKSDRHIVIHGASKQGKTVLRKNVLPEESSIVIQCRANTTLLSLYQEIFRQLDTQALSGATKTFTWAVGGTGEASARAGLPFFAEGEAKAEGTVEVENSNEKTYINLGHGPEFSLSHLAEEIKLADKKVVVEDFHYLPEDEKRRLAFDLKAFWDMGVFFIVVGIWSEQNLLALYNGDLTGRVEEIDVQWTVAELEEVINKGEQALDILFDDEIRAEIVADANQNVGLLQRILEKYCFECGVLQTRNFTTMMVNHEALDACRRRICEEEVVRYRQFCDAVMRGYKGFEESELKVYQHILRVFMEASDSEIRQGIHRNTVLSRVKAYEQRVRGSDLTAALNKLNKLQQDRNVSPLIFSYNPTSRLLQLVDRELLFYRKYGEPVWPWQEGEEDNNAICSTE